MKTQEQETTVGTVKQWIKEIRPTTFNFRLYSEGAERGYIISKLSFQGSVWNAYAGQWPGPYKWLGTVIDEESAKRLLEQHIQHAK